MMGVIIPLIGVLFGYTAIFLKVRSVKRMVRHHQQGFRKRISNSILNPNAPAATSFAQPARSQKPGFTQDDVKLAKTLFAAFLVFFVCWYV
jgi:hypothetical protein